MMNNQQLQPDKISIDLLPYMTTGNLTEKRMQTAGKLSFDLVNMIGMEIQENKFEVNDTKKEFKLKQKQNFDDSGRGTNNYQDKRIEAHNEFEENTHINHSHSQRKYFKSELTHEDVEYIKKLKIQRKKHEAEIQQKTKLYEENLKKFQQQEKELIEKQKKQKNQQRLKQVTKKIEEIRRRQQQRTKKIQEEKKRIFEINHQKKLHQKFQQHYKSVQQEEQRKRQEMKKVIKIQKKVNYDDLKQHQHKYDEIMRNQREERERKMGQLSRGTGKKYYCSKVLKDVIDQQTKAKVEQEEKKNQIMQKYLKKNEYAQHVRTKYLPNMPLKEEEEDKNKLNISRSVSVNQLHKMGNQFMKQAHQNIANLKASTVSKVTKKEEEPIRYKDYLKDLKLNRKLSSHKEGRYLQQIDNILKTENMTQQEKFTKAKLVTQKIQDKKGRNSQKLIHSINAKIHLLKQIESG